MVKSRFDLFLPFETKTEFSTAKKNYFVSEKSIPNEPSLCHVGSILSRILSLSGLVSVVIKDRDYGDAVYGRP